MSVLGTVLIGTCVVGVVGSLGYWFATEDERTKAEIQEIDQRIDGINQTINHFENLKSKLEKGKDYLNCSKSDFTDGGHVFDGIPLANSEFNSCIKKIEGAVSHINSLINDCKSELNDITRKKKELEAKLKN